MQYIAYWGLIAIVSAVLGAFLASVKNRDYSVWAAWSFLFPPLLIVLVLLPKLALPRRRRPTLDEEDAATP